MVSNSHPRLSIIIPVLNEAEGICAFLQSVQQTIQHQAIEVIVVDGGSTDGTAELANKYADQLLISSKGRALQMNMGARYARAPNLLFLHSDTQLPAPPLSFPFLSASLEDHYLWGFYRVKLSGDGISLRIIETMMVWRSSITEVATGDQCLFIKKTLFDQLLGFAEIPLMEDVEMSKRLRRMTPPLVIREPVVTSSRRWEKHGILKTVCKMWYLRALYFFGVSPHSLARYYYG